MTSPSDRAFLAIVHTKDHEPQNRSLFALLKLVIFYLLSRSGRTLGLYFHRGISYRLCRSKHLLR